MSVDRSRLTAALHNFYDFAGKVVLYVGAGRGQLLDPQVETRDTILIDRDEKSLTPNKAGNASAAQGHLKTAVVDFKELNIPGDVVYFEFCLHEMDDPQQAIVHAQTLARDVVIFEHSPGSEWVFYAAEDQDVIRSARALAQFPVKRREDVYAEQTFRDHAELVAKLSTQGDLAIQRALRLAGETDIVVPMRCILALL
jgi:hypothetical protein